MKYPFINLFIKTVRRDDGGAVCYDMTFLGGKEIEFDSTRLVLPLFLIVRFTLYVCLGRFDVAVSLHRFPFVDADILRK